MKTMNGKLKYFIRWAVIAIILYILSLLGGCQLAVEEQSVSADQFVGISVQLQPEFVFNHSSDEDYVDRSIPHEVDGEPLYLDISQTETGEPVMGINLGSWFTSLNQHFNTVDTDKERSETVLIEATMYVCTDTLSSTPYLIVEQVYRREDGTLYAVDCGNNYGGHLDGLSITLSENHTTSDTEGNRTLSTVEVKLHIKERTQTNEVRILAMKGTQIIEQFTICAENELWLPSDTEWVLAEEILSDGSIRRTALNEPLDNASVEMYTLCEGGVFIPQILTLRKLP